jgi:hypothetical protein
MSLYPKNYDHVGDDDEEQQANDGETAALLLSKEIMEADGGVGAGALRARRGIFYGSTSASSRMSVTTLHIQKRGVIVGKPALLTKVVPRQVAEVFVRLFLEEHPHAHNHPRTNPVLPPEKRFARHRNFYIYWLNQFRHWWKTSRLFIRMSGGVVYCEVRENWRAMGSWDVTAKRQLKAAAKQSKLIGQGGPMKGFLNQVQVFTRSIRIALACARAWEARVDNRLYEVGIAEALAFMGNRCARFWSRQFVDFLNRWVMLPVSGKYLAPHWPHLSRPVIVAMGFFRAILPFAMSFQGSRFGRQVVRVYFLFLCDDGWDYRNPLLPVDSARLSHTHTPCSVSLSLSAIFPPAGCRVDIQHIQVRVLPVEVGPERDAVPRADGNIPRHEPGSSAPVGGTKGVGEHRARRGSGPDQGQPGRDRL